MRIAAAGIVLLLFSSLASEGQTQLVLLNRDRVLVRYSVGDDFRIKLKNSNDYFTTFITDIQEFYVVAINDTIRFASIDRVSLKGKPNKRKNLVSKFLITAGITYFVLDQFNNVIVHGQPPDMEPSVWKPSLIMVGTGFAIKLFAKRSQKLRYPARLLRVERGSPFHEEVE